MAISIEVNRSSWDINISGWRAGTVPATRHHPDPAPREISRMTFTKAEKKGQRPIATGDDLVIPFYDLCHRQPRPDTPEGDFVFTKEEILDSEIAEKAWEYMEYALHRKRSSGAKTRSYEPNKGVSHEKSVI